MLDKIDLSNLYISFNNLIMVYILAISEYVNTYQNNETYQIVNVLYQKHGNLYYDTFQRLKEENTNYAFISNGLDIKYGSVDKNDLIITRENQNCGDTVLYTLSGINNSLRFSRPEILKQVKDVVSYLQVKYAGYIGDLDTIL